MTFAHSSGLAVGVSIVVGIRRGCETRVGTGSSYATGQPSSTARPATAPLTLVGDRSKKAVPHPRTDVRALSRPKASRLQGAGKQTQHLIEEEL